MTDSAERPSPWRGAFANRTYAAGALWAAGLALSVLTGTPDTGGGWLAIRLDAAGLLYAAASVVGGTNFFAAGVRALTSLRLDMNFLMSAAIVGAILIGEPFEAASLAFLFSFAELLERFAVDRGRRSIVRLVELVPERADRLRSDGTVESVPVTDLRVGDRVRIRPGDKIPADGTVVTGGSAVNEATITGESVPRRKDPGDRVFAATVNTDGALDIEVTADAAHSTLARIIQLVRDAEGRRAPIEQQVKRFARVYTPLVTVGAIIVMALPPLVLGADGLEWFVRGLTLLVIACPCALVIATPVTVVSALTSAARNGVLVKGGEHLERLGTVRAIAVDKTGTLTTGELTVQSFDTAGGTDGVALLRRVAAIESRSEHPVGRAIVRFAESRGASPGASTVAEFLATRGKGVAARVDGQMVRIGTSDFVGSGAVARPARAPANTATGTLIFARADDGAFGQLELADQLRPNAAEVIRELRDRGVSPIVMLTGDGPEPAEIVRTATGVDEARSRLLPEGKVAAIEELRARYGTVAMVGDGVNDAPALAAASIGIVMGAAGSPATIETADVALMADDLSRLPYAIGLARRAHRVIRFNIALALGLKLVLGFGAISGVVTLAVAVLVGDLGASVAVTANALRLARFKPGQGQRPPRRR